MKPDLNFWQVNHGENAHRCDATLGKVGAQCTARGRVERGGKWFCFNHDPVRVEAKREERRRLVFQSQKNRMFALHRHEEERRLMKAKAALMDQVAKEVLDMSLGFRNALSATVKLNVVTLYNPEAENRSALIDQLQPTIGGSRSAATAETC